MTKERWEVLKDLFEAALEREPADRENYLARYCAGDPEMLRDAIDLLRHHEAAASFLGEPPSAVCAAQTFSTGQFVSGRYEIIRLIGTGGMGEVYEAEDRDLAERVAVKTLRAEISADQRNMNRLLQEIQLARKVTHPNVCRVYDLARHKGGLAGDVLFLTMELVRGETLAERLRRTGPISAEQALPLVRQICAALDAAHGAGIIHRDFKSGNVMLSESPAGTRAVVTDFGLARTADLIGQAAESLTQTGAIVGTVAYMAPEQLEGADASIRSDIYSLGVVMYEMATGRKPFSTDGPLRSVLGRLRKNPERPSKFVSGIGAQWERAMLRCLAPDPNERFQSASQVAEAIASPEKPFLPRIVSRRKVIWTCTGASVVALSAVGIRLFEWKAGIREGDSVLLTELENSTNDAEMDAVTDLLRTQLGQSAHFRIVERSRMKQLLEGMGQAYSLSISPQTAREMAWRDRSAMVIFGGVSKLGGGYVLNLKLERIAGQPRASGEWTQSFPVSNKTQMLATVDSASNWIRHMAGEAGDQANALDRPAQDTTTTSWEALLLYSQAEKLKTIDHTEEAIDKLGKAVQVDSNFALAWMRMGDLSNSLGREDDGFHYWSKALETLKVRPLTERERLRIRGLFAADTGDFENAIKTFRSFEMVYPHDYLPTFYLAGALINTGRSEEALSKLAEAARKEPAAYVVPARAARLNLVLGRYDAVAREIDRLRALGYNSNASLIEAEADFCQARWDRSEALLRELAQSPNQQWKSRGCLVFGCLLAEYGRYRESVRLLQDGIDFDRAHGLTSSLVAKYLASAYLFLRTTKQANCRAACMQALNVEHGRRHLVTAVTLLARAGFVREAEAGLRQLDNRVSGPVFDIARHRLRGEILLAQDKAEAAVSEMRQADALLSPTECREFLAHALARAGQKREAEGLYRTIAVAPARIWNAPDLEAPGLWADALFEHGRLAAENGNRADAQSSLTRLLDVRKSADGTISDLDDARSLLGRIAKMQSNLQSQLH